jgi:hypothetical protein
LKAEFCTAASFDSLIDFPWLRRINYIFFLLWELICGYLIIGEHMLFWLYTKEQSNYIFLVTWPRIHSLFTPLLCYPTYLGSTVGVWTNWSGNYRLFLSI